MTYIKDAEHSCDECRKTFKSARALAAHNESKHSEPSAASLALAARLNRYMGEPVGEEFEDWDLD